MYVGFLSSQSLSTRSANVQYCETKMKTVLSFQDSVLISRNKFEQIGTSMTATDPCVYCRVE
jgi:hypothetical protein